MLQRVQSLYLVGSIVCLILAFVFPYLEIESAEPGVFMDWYVRLASDSFMALLLVMAVLLTGGVIFLYKKRKLQVKLIWVANALILISYAFLIGGYFLVNNGFLLENLKLGSVFPLIALILNVLAIRFINKDEKLIKSLNRIR